MTSSTPACPAGLAILRGVDQHRPMAQRSGAQRHGGWLVKPLLWRGLHQQKLIHRLELLQARYEGNRLLY